MADITPYRALKHALESIPSPELESSHTLLRLLKSALRKMQEFAPAVIKAEVLFCNREQGVLEQVAQIGFDMKAAERNRSMQGAVDAQQQLAGLSPEEARRLRSGVGICAEVAVTGREAIVSDVAVDTRYRPISINDDTQSEAAFPLTLNGDTVGVLNLESPQEQCFTEAVVDAARRATEVLAYALVFEQGRSEEYFDQEVFRVLHDTVDQSAALETFLRLALELLNENRGCVLRRRPGGDLEVIASIKLEKLKAGEVRPVSDFGSIRAAIAEGSDKGVYYQYGADEHELRRFTDAPLRSNFAIAIRFQQEVFGVLNIESENSLITERYRNALAKASRTVAMLMRGVEAATMAGWRSANDELDVELHTVVGTLEVVSQKHWRDLERETGLSPETKLRIKETREDMKSLLARVRRAHRLPRLFGVSVTTFDLRDVLGKLKATPSPLGRDIELTITFPTERAIRVRGGENGFRQVLENLVLNSVKHRPVRAANANDESDRVKASIAVDYAEAASAVTLTYWDNGQARASLDDLDRSSGRGIKHVRLISQLVLLETQP